MKSNYLILFIIVALLPMPAHAYIDPGVQDSNAIIGAIVGIFVAIGLALKTYWYKVKAMLTGANKNPPPAESPAQNDE